MFTCRQTTSLRPSFDHRQTSHIGPMPLVAVPDDGKCFQRAQCSFATASGAGNDLQAKKGEQAVGDVEPQIVAVAVQEFV